MLPSLVLAALAGCGAPSAEAPPAAGSASHAHHDHAAHDHAHHEAPPAAPGVSGASIYQVDATFTDATGATVRLADLAGRPRLLAMAYTHCTSACPRIVSDMGRIADGLGDAADGLGMVLVSLDPERDTPERLRVFAEERGLDPSRWTLLRGAEDDVRVLATVLGVQYRRISPEDFAHSNVVHVLDAEGVVTHRQEGLGLDPGPTVAAARALLRD